MSTLSGHKFKIGAVIVRKGRILSSGCNQAFKTHTYINDHGEDFNKTVHAEICAIFRLKNRELLRGSTIVVYREKKDGSFARARPCPMCFELIRKYGIKKMQYTTDAGIEEEYVA